MEGRRFAVCHVARRIHTGYGTVMRMLDDVVEFTPLAEREGGRGKGVCRE